MLCFLKNTIWFALFLVAGCRISQTACGKFLALALQITLGMERSCLGKCHQNNVDVMDIQSNKIEREREDKQTIKQTRRMHKASIRDKDTRQTNRQDRRSHRQDKQKKPTIKTNRKDKHTRQTEKTNILDKQADKQACQTDTTDRQADRQTEKIHENIL